jgi:hypothetical protein
LKRKGRRACAPAALAYSAHADNDTKSAHRLEEVHTAIATHASTLASLDAALRAAGNKLEKANGWPPIARRGAGRWHVWTFCFREGAVMDNDKEKKLRAFLLTGMSQVEIARQLHVTPAYVSAAMLKLGLRAGSPQSPEKVYLAEEARRRRISVARLRQELIHHIAVDRLCAAVMDDAGEV